jgi:UDP-MurNAc hydroxylase
MKFAILSHAGLCVEHNGVKIVSDPWLLGSCYWRSWWNYPEPPRDLIENLRPDFVYITHLHWDHFHGASLKKLFSPDAHILVPKVPTERMVRDLKWLGFHNVTEIAHGSGIQLGEDFTLRSYQFGLSGDSAMLLSGGGYTIFNCNDCKYFGLPLREITDRFPKIDFVLRSHSSASAIPYCIEGYKDTFPELRRQKDYIEEFSRFALFVGARYAIPFASNHCFLHRDTVHFNDTAVAGVDIPDYYKQMATQFNRQSECVVMPPGSSWSDKEGFRIVDFDYSSCDQYIERLLKRHAGQLERQYAKEEQALADFNSFRTYFTDFLRSIPWPVRKWLGRSVVFRTHDAKGEHNWLVDIPAAKVEVLAFPRDDLVVLETPALVLNDCTKIWMFSVWTASKRLKIHLPSPADLSTVEALFGLLDLYELETLPLGKNFSLRVLGIRLRRWREAVEFVRLVLRHKVFRRPFVVAGLYDLSYASLASRRLAHLFHSGGSD